MTLLEHAEPAGSSGASTNRPRGLKARGRALWFDVAGTYDLRPDELAVLESACRILDELQRMQRELGQGTAVVEGASGQPRANPLGAEVRGHRDLLAKHLRSLALPDLPRTAQLAERSASSQRHADAAKARWDRVRALRDGVSGG